MDLAAAAFIVEALGLLVAGISLGWQIVSFLLTGIRLKVETRQMMIASGPGRPHEAVVMVTARNVGRQAVSVSSCWLQPPDGHGLFQPNPHPMNQRLPYTIEPGHHSDYIFAEEDLLASARPEERELVLRGGYSLATGKSPSLRRPSPSGGRRPRGDRLAHQLAHGWPTPPRSLYPWRFARNARRSAKPLFAGSTPAVAFTIAQARRGVRHHPVFNLKTQLARPPRSGASAASADGAPRTWRRGWPLPQTPRGGAGT